MYLVAIAWLYVALMMALAEAMHANGTVLGAIVTFLFYGLLPTGLVMYVMGTPLRRKARLAAEAEELATRRALAAATSDGHPVATAEAAPTAQTAPSMASAAATSAAGDVVEPDAGRHAACAAEPGTVAPVGKPG